jgi:hypothetical protein
MCSCRKWGTWGRGADRWKTVNTVLHARVKAGPVAKEDRFDEQSRVESIVVLIWIYDSVTACKSGNTP